MWFNCLSTCILCNDGQGIVCEDCEQLFSLNYEKKFSNYNLISPYIYKYPLSQLILKFKYNDKQFLGDYFAQCILKRFDIKPYQKLVPIPISKAKLLTRGYNQAFLLAKAISSYIGNELAPMALVSKNTTYNVDTKAIDRLKKAQLIELGEPIINKSIIIVDDVIASGSTMNRAINLLSPYVSDISILSIAT